MIWHRAQGKKNFGVKNRPWDFFGLKIEKLGRLIAKSQIIQKISYTV